MPREGGDDAGGHGAGEVGVSDDADRLTWIGRDAKGGKGASDGGGTRGDPDGAGSNAAESDKQGRTQRGKDGAERSGSGALCVVATSAVDVITVHWLTGDHAHSRPCTERHFNAGDPGVRRNAMRCAVVVPPQGGVLLAGTQDDGVHAFRLADKRFLGALSCPAGVLDLAVSSSGRHLFGACADGVLRVWDLQLWVMCAAAMGGAEPTEVPPSAASGGALGGRAASYCGLCGTSDPEEATGVSALADQPDAPIVVAADASGLVCWDKAALVTYGVSSDAGDTLQALQRLAAGAGSEGGVAAFASGSTPVGLLKTSPLQLAVAQNVPAAPLVAEAAARGLPLAPDATGRTALHDAAEHRDWDTVRQLATLLPRTAPALQDAGVGELVSVLARHPTALDHELDRFLLCPAPSSLSADLFAPEDGSIPTRAILPPSGIVVGRASSTAAGSPSLDTAQWLGTVFPRPTRAQGGRQTEEGADSEATAVACFFLAGRSTAGVPSSTAAASVPRALSRSLLHTVVASGREEPFNSVAARGLLEWKWQAYGRRLFYREFSFYALFVFLFILFSWTLQRVGEGNFVGPDQAVHSALATGLSAALLAMAARLLAREAAQARAAGLAAYVSDGWNWVDLASLGLLVAAVAAQLARAGDLARTIAAPCAVLMYAKLLYFMRGFSSLGALVRMVAHSAIHMRFFLVVLAVLCLGFANAFYLLLAVPDGDWARPGEPVPEDFASPQMAVLTVFRWMLGDWDTAVLGTRSRTAVIAWLLFVIFAVLVVVVMLNLLIAILSDAYGYIRDRASIAMHRERARLLVEYESLMTRAEREREDWFPEWLLILAPADAVSALCVG